MNLLGMIGGMGTDEQMGKDGFYEAAYTLEEVAELVGRAIDEGVGDELTAVRIAIRRALLKMEGELEAAEFARMVGLIFQGANTVAYLLKTHRMISGESADAIVGSLAQILLELGGERGWDLSDG